MTTMIEASKHRTSPEIKALHRNGTGVSTRGAWSKGGTTGGAYEVGMRTRGNENEGETYWIRTGSELTGVVSERVLTVPLRFRIV